MSITAFDLRCWKKLRLCDLCRETNNTHTEGIHSEADEGTLMAGYRSISNDDAIDWLPRPVVLFNSPLFLFSFSFSNCSADAEKSGSESRFPSSTWSSVYQAADAGIGLPRRINSHRGDVVFTAEYDVVLQQWRATLVYIHLLFTAFLRRHCFDAAWSVPPPFFDSRWLGARSAHLPAGSQLPSLCGEGGGRAEETAGGVRNLHPQQLKAAKPIQLPSFLYFILIIFFNLNISRGQCLAALGECFLVALCVPWNAALLFVLVPQSDKGIKKKI